MSDNTLLQVLGRMEAEGYTVQLAATEDGLIHCSHCRQDSEPTAVRLDQLARLEGASDPDDMLAVLAVTCPHCGSRGTVVVHYGPEASAGEAAVLRALDDRRPR